MSTPIYKLLARVYDTNAQESRTNLKIFIRETTASGGFLSFWRERPKTWPNKGIFKCYSGQTFGEEHCQSLCCIGALATATAAATTSNNSQLATPFGLLICQTIGR